MQGSSGGKRGVGEGGRMGRQSGRTLWHPIVSSFIRAERSPRSMDTSAFVGPAGRIGGGGVGGPAGGGV